MYQHNRVLFLLVLKLDFRPVGVLHLGFGHKRGTLCWVLNFDQMERPEKSKKHECMICSIKSIKFHRLFVLDLAVTSPLIRKYWCVRCPDLVFD